MAAGGQAVLIEDVALQLVELAAAARRRWPVAGAAGNEPEREECGPAGPRAALPPAGHRCHDAARCSLALGAVDQDRLHAALGELFSAHLCLLTRQPFGRIVWARVVVVFDQE